MSDNELVAEFMLKQEKFKMTGCIGIANGLYQIGDPSDKIPSFQNVKLRYRESWDWLMPVLDKIRSMGREVLLEMDLYVGISTNRVVIRDFRKMVGDRQVAYTKGAGNLIDVAYKAVIEFIEDYNKHYKDEVDIV